MARKRSRHGRPKLPSPGARLSDPKAPSNRRNWRAVVLLAAALVVATALVYAPVRHFDFVSFDDPDYITSNAHIPAGLRLDNIVWALTAVRAGTWMPATWLSYMADAT